MQRLLVRPQPLPCVEDADDVQLCAAAAIDFMGEISGGNSSDSNAELPCGESVLEGKVWKFGGDGIMVAAAVRAGGWADSAPHAAVSVVHVQVLEELSLSVQNTALA
jgi:hypothetical protein